MAQIVIDRRYCGPTGSANGGYVAGLLARAIGPIAAVRLQRPPPLDRPLSLEGPIDGRWYLRDGDTAVAMGARRERLALDVPPPPSAAALIEAAGRFAGRSRHWFPHCFGCGTERDAGDGLGIFPGPTGHDGIVAAPWTVSPALAPDGELAPEFLWTALDCVGGWALQQCDQRSMVLGTLTASVTHLPAAGETCAAIGWPLSGAGRKYEAGTAVFDSAGRLCGAAKAIWIVVE